MIFQRLHRALVRLIKSRRFLPQSAMGKAINYAIGQWPGLSAWLSAILYTIIEACRRQGIDPFAYLRDVFIGLPAMTTRQIPSITPANWAKALRLSAEPIAA